MNKKRVVVLGSTGSIGQNTLDVINNNVEEYELIGLSANKNLSLLEEQIRQHHPSYVAVTGYEETESNRLRLQFEANVGEYIKKLFWGKFSHLNMVREIEAEIVVNGIAGAAGLTASVESIKSGKDLALANKETVVLAGEYIKKLVGESKVKLLPVDSEHSAVFFLLDFIGKRNVEEIILTASGGPFRDLDYDSLKRVTVDDALNHPTWRMGKKITIDSATMANKGLEVIEAQQLFGFDLEKIRVVIHRESKIHSFIRTIDGVLYAQVSNPDMRMPINNALSYPRLRAADYGRLDFTNFVLSFDEVDYRKYRMLKLAYEAARMGNAYRIVYNAANEVAVSGFVSGRIGFLEIPVIVERVMDMDWSVESFDLEDILRVDREGRKVAESVCNELERKRD